MANDEKALSVLQHIRTVDVRLSLKGLLKLVFQSPDPGIRQFVGRFHERGAAAIIEIWGTSGDKPEELDE